MQEVKFARTTIDEPTKAVLKDSQHVAPDYLHKVHPQGWLTAFSYFCQDFLLSKTLQRLYRYFQSGWRCFFKLMLTNRWSGRLNNCKFWLVQTLSFWGTTSRVQFHLCEVSITFALHLDHGQLVGLEYTALAPLVGGLSMSELITKLKPESKAKIVNQWQWAFGGWDMRQETKVLPRSDDSH